MSAREKAGEAFIKLSHSKHRLEPMSDAPELTAHSIVFLTFTTIVLSEIYFGFFLGGGN